MELMEVQAAGITTAPGPMGWPCHSATCDDWTQSLTKGLQKLSEKYGGIVHLKMGFRHTIAVSSPEMAKQVLQAQDNIFSDRPATIAITYLTYDRVDMAFADYGPFWRQMRKLCVMKLFSRRRAESWASVRDEVDSMIKITAENSGLSVNLGEMVFGLTHDIIYRAAFGSSSIEGKQEFITRSALDGFIDKIIDEHMKKEKKAVDENVESDMVDEMLAFYSDENIGNDVDDLQTTIKLTRDNIKAIIMDVMFGGTETVASAIEWAMAELMHTPEALKRVQQRELAEFGLNRRPFTLQGSRSDGYHIPKGTRVMINLYAINRNKKDWEYPEVFNPSRFLQTGTPDFKGSNFEFLPFGSGRRSCPGMQLGLYTMESALAHLLHCFTWKLPDGMKPSEIDMGDVYGLTAPKASRLVVVPTPRLFCSLY
ncbi:cytochrome P450 84A1-like protein [Tanacetum coccineum]